MGARRRNAATGMQVECQTLGVGHSVLDSGQSDCHTILGGETAKLKTMVADPISLTPFLATPFLAQGVQHSVLDSGQSRGKQRAACPVRNQTSNGVVCPVAKQSEAKFVVLG